VADLSDEDRLLLGLCKIERFGQRLKLIVSIDSFDETFTSISKQMRYVVEASQSVKRCNKLEKILEVVLALGNYMNSARRGVTYGFRLQSLDMLMDCRTTDKKWTLMHFLAQTVAIKFQDLSEFYSELKHIEEASKIPMETLTMDVNQLSNSMEMAINELQQCSPDNQPPRLVGFVHTYKTQVDALKEEATRAKVLFEETAEWYGEGGNKSTPETFFGVLARFVNNFKKAADEYEKHRRRQMMLEMGDNASTNVASSKRKEPCEDPFLMQKKLAQDATRHSRRRKNRTRQINDGVMDEILAGLGSEPLQAHLHPSKRSGTSAYGSGNGETPLLV
jgi:formic-like protein